MLLQHNPDAAVAKLWGEFYEYLANISHECGSFTIYIHNLGGFDGIFIYKYLASVSNDVDAIIDSSNKFITISGSIFTNGSIHGKVNLEFKDSYRVFPVSTFMDKIYVKSLILKVKLIAIKMNITK